MCVRELANSDLRSSYASFCFIRPGNRAICLCPGGLLADAKSKGIAKIGLGSNHFVLTGRWPSALAFVWPLKWSRLGSWR